MTFVEFAAVLSVFISSGALGLSARAHENSQRVRQGPPGATGPMGPPGECRCWQEDEVEHDKPKPESDGEIKGRWGWPE